MLEPGYQLSPIAHAVVALFAHSMSQHALAQQPPAQQPPSPPAGIAPAASDSASTKELDEVRVRAPGLRDEYAPATSTIGGKTEMPLRDIPQTVNVINRAVLEAQGARSFKDALRNVPGIAIGAGEGGVIGDNITLRGFGARTDIFLDGFRDRGQYTRDVFSLDAIEVLKGPASMLFGRGSTGGVINQVSKRPRKEPLTEGVVEVGTQSHVRTTVDVNQPVSATAAFRLAAVAQKSESTRDVLELERAGVAPSFRWGMGTPTEFTLSALVQKSRDVPDYGFPFLPVSSAGVGTVRRPVDAPANRYYGYQDDFLDQDVAVFSAALEHRFTPNLRLKSRIQSANSETRVSPSRLGAPTVIAGAPPGTVAVQGTSLDLLQSVREELNRTQEDRSLYNQTDLIARFDTGAVAHTLTTGFEIGRDESDTTTFDWTVPNSATNLGNPSSLNRPGTPFLVSSSNPKASTLALYINDQLDLGKQWKLVGGLRWDRFKAETVNRAGLATATPTTTTIDAGTDTHVSTRAGVIWQPSDAQSYYVSYGTSFNPSAETVSVQTSTAALEPEKNRSYELGAKWDVFGGNLGLNAALFRIEKTNARTPDPVNATVTILDGKQRVDGIEVGAAGRLAPGWQIYAGYTFLDSEVLESNTVGTGLDLGLRQQGKALQNTPRHTATLWTTYEFAGGFEIGGGVLHTSKRFLNNFETSEVDAFTRLDATLAWRQETYDLRLNLLNATDELYFEAAAGTRAIPANGRQLRASVTVRF